MKNLLKSLVESLIVSLTMLMKSKTFTFIVLVFVVATIALFVGKITGDMWTSLMNYAFGGTVVRGTAEHFTQKWRITQNEIKADVARESDADLARDAARVSGAD